MEESPRPGFILNYQTPGLKPRSRKIKPLFKKKKKKTLSRAERLVTTRLSSKTLVDPLHPRPRKSHFSTEWLTCHFAFASRKKRHSLVTFRNSSIRARYFPKKKKKITELRPISGFGGNSPSNWRLRDVVNPISHRAERGGGKKGGPPWLWSPIRRDDTGKRGGRGRGRMARSHPWERLFNFTKNAGSISLNGSDILTLCARQAWATGCLIKLGRLNYGALSSQRPLFYSRLSFIRGRLSTRRSFKNFFRRFFFLSFFSSLDSMIHTGWAFYFLM